MADVADTTPPAVDQTDNLTIWWVPTIADKLSPKASTEIGAATAFRLTYSFTSDGWAPVGDQEVTKDARLTLKQDLEAFGKTTSGLTLKYVDSTDPKSAAVVLASGLSGYFVERRGLPNSVAAAAAQKGRVFAVTLGEQIPGPVDGTGKFNIAQKVILTAVVGPAVAFAA